MRAAEPTWRSELARLSDAVRDSQDASDDGGVGDEALFDGLPEASDVRVDERERVLLVGLRIKSRLNSASFTAEESVEELERLAETAGLRVVGTTLQSLERPNAGTFIGSGKVAEVVEDVRALQADTVIFDTELSSVQQRSLEDLFGAGVRIADRTALILDIFEQRAQSKEGKLQVRLAAASYQMPRLRRRWTHLERQSGAGATRGGMGELQKEVDKRLLRDEMAQLRREIEGVRSHRQAHRARRRAASFPVVALIGYTNAGKSTLMNQLTNAAAFAEDRLFATLDPRTRRAALPSGKVVLMSDTVGFIQKLPTTLIAAFRATLEEIEEADVLLHVVDVSHPDAAKQSDTVHTVLSDIAVSSDLPMVTVWNKVDASPRPEAVIAAAEHNPTTVAASALSGQGVPDILATIEAALEEAMEPFEALVPYSDGAVISQLREAGVVRAAEYGADGVHVRASADLATIARLGDFVTARVPRERVFEWRRDEALSSLVPSASTATAEPLT